MGPVGKTFEPELELAVLFKPANEPIELGKDLLTVSFALVEPVFKPVKEALKVALVVELMGMLRGMIKLVNELMRCVDEPVRFEALAEMRLVREREALFDIPVDRAIELVLLL